MVHIKKLSVSTEKCSNAGVVFSTIKQIKYFFTFQRVYISKKKKKVKDMEQSAYLITKLYLFPFNADIEFP